MPVHDWTRVDAGTFHDFHNSWVVHLKEALNTGLLPDGYYAQVEQHAGERIADVLALHTGDGPPTATVGDSGTATLAPPVAGVRLTADRPYVKGRRKTLAVRNVAGHRIVALVEIASRANKDRRRSVTEFVTKVVAALNSGVHVVVVDLYPPGRPDPRGLHGAIWAGFSSARIDRPTKPFAFASYVATDPVEAYLVPAATGDPVPDLPLFLTPHRHLTLPLADTYATAFRGVPSVWRDVLDAPPPVG